MLTRCLTCQGIMRRSGPQTPRFFGECGLCGKAVALVPSGQDSQASFRYPSWKATIIPLVILVGEILGGALLVASDFDLRAPINDENEVRKTLAEIHLGLALLFNTFVTCLICRKFYVVGCQVKGSGGERNGLCKRAAIAFVESGTICSLPILVYLVLYSIGVSIFVKRLLRPPSFVITSCCYRLTPPSSCLSPYRRPQG